MASELESARTEPDHPAAAEELRRWKQALGWWSGLPAQEAFDLWANRRGEADETEESRDDRR